MRGVIYARYSEGPRQTDQSIEGQVADCKAYALEKGIDIVDVYADRHVSGKSLEGRDEFQRMMRDADRKRFDVVVVWKIEPRSSSSRRSCRELVRFPLCARAIVPLQ